MHLAVERAHPDDTLVALAPQPGLDLGCELDLGHALAEHAGDAFVDSGDHGPGLTDALELPRALHRSQPPDQARAVRELEGAQPLRVVEVAERRQHVELEAEPTARDAGPVQRRGEIPQRAERLDALERRLGPRPLERPAHEQDGLALGRDDEVGVLRRTGEVVEVDGLDEHGAVQLVVSQGLLEGADTALHLSCGDELIHRGRFCP